MSKVDHVLAATTALYYADEYRDREEVGSSQRQELAAAQVHATLALVEEQRTATLAMILLSPEGMPGKYTEASIANARANSGTTLLEQYLEHNRMVDQLRERLGLDS